MSQRKNPQPIGDVVVRYSAEEMPLPTLVKLQHETVRGLQAQEIPERDALRVLDLLLTIALRKLDVSTAVR